VTKFFRFLTGEINGFYLRAIHDILNEYSSDIYETLCYMSLVQFYLEDEGVPVGTIPIADSDVKGIAAIAGVFNQYVSAESNKGSILFTSSKIVDGYEYSDRALYNMPTESFKFVRTNQDIYASDIVTLSSPTLRASLVPEGTPVIGYIAEDAVFFNADGSINTSAISPTPPVGKAYYPYYGENYLFLAETFLVEAYLDPLTFKKMLETYQVVRYNGPNIKSILDATSIICEDYIQDIRFESVGTKIILYYQLNQESELISKIKKLFVWRKFMERKFKYITLSEVIQ
jgi:hypothetical protein